jgi:hypothetical protein
MRGQTERLALAGATLALAALPAEAGAADPAPVQPLVSGPAPARSIELPFGSAELSPSSLIAADGAERLDVSVELDADADARELVAVLYAPAGRDPRHGGAPLEALVLDAAIGRVAGSATASDLALRAINPPPGSLRLDLVARDREAVRLVASTRIPVHAQHRLPPGVSPSAGGALAETFASPFSGLAAGELGPTPDALPGGTINSNLTATAKGFEAETYVAMQPNDPNRVIAASNPGSFKSSPPAFISDGGLAPGTVTTRVLPRAAMLENGTVANMRLCCDPALAADRDGNLWYAVLSLGAKSHIVINRVAAGTTGFQPVGVAIPRNGKGFQDKEMIAIDNWPQSPKYGRLYATWVENRGRRERQNVVVSECDTRPGGVAEPERCDNPANWTPGASLAAGGDKSGIFT